MEYILFASHETCGGWDPINLCYRPRQSTTLLKTNFIHSGDSVFPPHLCLRTFLIPHEIAIGLAVADFVLHYLIDCSKTNTVRYFNWDRDLERFGVYKHLTKKMALHSYLHAFNCMS